MTKDEALKLALEALELAEDGLAYSKPVDGDKLDAAITTIKQALEAPVQEPVATLIDHYAFTDGIVRFDGVENMEQLPVGTKFYTALPAAPVQEPVALKPCWYESKEKTMCRKCGQVHAEAIITAAPVQEPIAWIERDMMCDDFDPDSVTCEKPDISAEGWEWVPLVIATTPPAAQQEPVALEPTIKLALTHIEGIKQDPHSSLTQSRARLAVAVLERITNPLAAPTVQEESHWIDDENRIKWLLWRVKDLEKRLQDTNPLAAQRQWVGLTSQDWNVIGFTSEFRAGAEWANDKLKEKNA